MKIIVQAKPNAKKQSIKKIDDLNYIVKVKEPPIKGLANQAIISLLSKYFNIAPSNIKIISGYSSRHKVIEIK